MSTLGTAAVLKMDDAAAPWAAKITNIDSVGEEHGEYRATHLQSIVEERLPVALPNPTDLTLTGLTDPAEKPATGGDPVPIAFDWADGTTWTGEGWVKSFVTNGPLEEAMEFTAVITPTKVWAAAPTAP